MATEKQSAKNGTAAADIHQLIQTLVDELKSVLFNTVSNMDLPLTQAELDRMAGKLHKKAS